MDRERKLKREVLSLRLENEHLRNQIKLLYIRLGQMKGRIDYLLFSQGLEDCDAQ